MRTAGKDLSPRGAATARVAAVAALAAAVLLGCSDDIVCPDQTRPFVSAMVEQVSIGRSGATLVDVYVSGDPIPEVYAVSLNDRQLPDPVPATDPPGLVTSLAETTVVWPPGTDCVLSLANQYGIASAAETVPGAFEVSAPGTVQVGGEAAITWSASEDADYYLLEATLAGATAGTTDVTEVVEGLSFDLDLSGFSGAGLVTGRVSAVSGPLSTPGTPGNVTGEGWGFLNISYSDAGATINIVVSETGARRP